MRTLIPFPFILAMLALQVAVAFSMTPTDDGRPVLVISRPGVSVDLLISRAGGYQIGIATPLIGAFAHSQAPGFAARLKAAGALVLGTRLASSGCVVS